MKVTEQLAMAAPFVFPKAHAFPPMYTIQPNPVTRAAQFGRWSSLVQQYCQHHRIFRLELPASYESPLFVNADISRRLAPDAVAQVLDFMASDQGGHRGAWIFRQAFWVYWKTPEEWADVLMRWVEQVGQKNVVLTFYELLHGDGSLGQGIGLFSIAQSC